ncbi:MAG TPA: coniferyl aldehyde dehydrogenase [Xanthomonadaceae bacterium]|nr:coniferyl aldehyde dehydrogenase [Xanthomonadaceae bacterium]
MDMTAPTPIEDLKPTLDRLRAAHMATPPDYAQRIDDLKRFRTAFKARLQEMTEVMAADFGLRSRHESLLADGMTVLHEVDCITRRLKRWMKPKRVGVGLNFLPARAEVRPQPLGVVGILGPWNYPVNLALMPLVSAIGAGNHVMLKPSEHTPRTAEWMRELLTEVFPADRVATVLGGPELAAAFSALPFDHLFFTGSTAVGRKVMAAAAPNLTPVTLELGGKSPAIIAPGYDIEHAAQRIATGKLLNAGQTCVAPDYVMLPADQVEVFATSLKAIVKQRYADLEGNPDYTAIVNDNQYSRLTGLVDDARQRGTRVIELLPGDSERRQFAPTLVIAPDDAHALMREEIFGPVLPILPYDSLDQAIAYVNAHDRPLALYHFDDDRARTRDVLERTWAGGVTVNDCMMHVAPPNLPFGGIGASGMGAYHGEAGFRTFSKMKPVFYQTKWNAMRLFVPPYRKLADFLVRYVTR